MTNDNSANNPVPNFYRASAADFKKIPGSPIAYWVSEKEQNNYNTGKILSSAAKPKKGIDTGDNARFLRFWYEISSCRISFRNDEYDKSDSYDWFSYNKGGKVRKWYGNREYIVNWEKNGQNLKDRLSLKKAKPTLRNLKFMFKECFTWTTVSSSNFSARYCPAGAMFDNGGCSLFVNEDSLFSIGGYINSIVAKRYFDFLSPTLNFQPGDVGNLLWIESNKYKSDIVNFVKECIEISTGEWDSREFSRDFTKNELLRHKTTDRIEDAYNNYCTHWKNQFFKLHANEEELNRIFIDIYDLADELTPDVLLKDITILKDESEIKDGELVFKKETPVKQFISYSVGCMFGRYSLDKPGLILANQGETINDYLQQVHEPSFMPDDDNVIPILEDEYFTDDIVSRFREFLKATFGAESLAENLEFIAGALSKSKKGGGSPEKVIRDYFLKSFFKDHVKMYKKMPIYWLFTSGKGRGFNALVYMHRYDRETLAKLRTDYLLKLEDKLDARIGMLGDESAAERGKLGKQMEELMDYDAVLNNKALEYIDIDLDDGVKVNYARFEGLVGKI